MEAPGNGRDSRCVPRGAGSQACLLRPGTGLIMVGAMGPQILRWAPNPSPTPMGGIPMTWIRTRTLPRQSRTLAVVLFLVFQSCAPGNQASESSTSPGAAAPEPTPEAGSPAQPASPTPAEEAQGASAEAVLAAALAEADRTERLVFLHSGAPW